MEHLGTLIAAAVVLVFVAFVVKKVKDAKDNRDNNTGGGSEPTPREEVDRIEP